MDLDSTCAEQLLCRILSTGLPASLGKVPVWGRLSTTRTRPLAFTRPHVQRSFGSQKAAYIFKAGASLVWGFRLNSLSSPPTDQAGPSSGVSRRQV